MKILIVLFFTLTLYAQDNETTKHIEQQIEKEIKYSKEQKFYGEDEYDFEGAKVDENTLKQIPPQPDYNDDFDMTNVYD